MRDRQPVLENEFAKYFRNRATNLDYPDQRFHSSTFGRFMSGDGDRRGWQDQDDDDGCGGESDAGGGTERGRRHLHDKLHLRHAEAADAGAHAAWGLHTDPKLELRSDDPALDQPNQSGE